MDEFGFDHFGTKKLYLKFSIRALIPRAQNISAVWPTSPLPTLRPPVPLTNPPTSLQPTLPCWSQPIIAALIRAPSTGGRRTLPWLPTEVMLVVGEGDKQRLLYSVGWGVCLGCVWEGVTFETSRGFNLNLVIISLIKSQSKQENIHTPTPSKQEMFAFANMHVQTPKSCACMHRERLYKGHWGAQDSHIVLMSDRNTPNPHSDLTTSAAAENSVQNYYMQNIYSSTHLSFTEICWSMTYEPTTQVLNSNTPVLCNYWLAEATPPLNQRLLEAMQRALFNISLTLNPASHYC